MSKAMTLDAFLVFLRALPAAVEAAEHAGLEHAARLIEAEAKAELGHYQDAAAPFPGWAELSDVTKADRVQQGFSENEPGLRNGEMRDSIKHQVGDKESVVGSDDEKLVWFELGTSKQPPRSVLGIAAVRNVEKVAHAIGGSVAHAIAGRPPPWEG